MATEYQELLDVMRAIEKSTAFIARRCAALRGVPTNVRPPAPHTIHVPADAPTALNWRPLFGTEHAVHIASARDGQYVVSRLDLSSGNVLWFADREPRGEQQWTGVLTVEQADAKAACQHHADTGRWPDAPAPDAPAQDTLQESLDAISKAAAADGSTAFGLPYTADDLRRDRASSDAVTRVHRCDALCPPSLTLTRVRSRVAARLTEITAICHDEYSKAPFGEESIEWRLESARAGTLTYVLRAIDEEVARG